MYEHVRDLYDNMIVRLLRRDWAGPKKKLPDIATQTLDNLQRG